MKELTIGYLLDLIIGDPQNPIHPIRLIGSLCKRLENIFRGTLKNSLKIAGLLTWVFSILIVYLISCFIVKISFNVNYVVGIVVSGIMIYFAISAKALKVEGLKVIKFLLKDDIEGARKQLSYIVGRDTKSLDKEGILRAVVETIAENMSDGVVAPIFYAGLFGAPFAFVYKAVNTMDSMVGYKNETYLHFGWAAAKLDDIVNWIPSRLSALLMIVSAYLLQMNGRNAWKIWRRDRRKHASPNSAQTESVCSGALGVELAGDAVYFGKKVKKPTIGDALRDIEPKDIRRANWLMYGSEILLLILGIGIRVLLLKIAGV